jgi:hypothetical protein
MRFIIQRRANISHKVIPSIDSDPDEWQSQQLSRVKSFAADAIEESAFQVLCEILSWDDRQLIPEAISALSIRGRQPAEIMLSIVQYVSEFRLN